MVVATTEKGEARTLLVKGEGLPVVSLGNELKFGDWEVDGVVRGDNCDPVRIAYAFNIGDGGTVRSLEPRLLP